MTDKNRVAMLMQARDAMQQDLDQIARSYPGGKRDSDAREKFINAQGALVAIRAELSWELASPKATTKRQGSSR